MTSRSNLVGRVPPTPTDDVNKGYELGSRWIDKIHNRKYTCADATNQAAIWIEDYADVTDPASVANAGAVMDSDFQEEEGFMRKTGEGTYEALKSNMEASAAPTTSDDANSGYAIGSRWFDTTSEEEYVCFDATAGAAVWIETTASYTHPQEPPCRAATAAQTGHATAAQITKLAGIETGATKYPDTGEQAFLDADHTKLNGIDTGATDDQTGAEIKAAYEAEADTNAYDDDAVTKLAGIETGATKYPDTGEQAFLDADHTKLNGIDTGADVTGSNPPQAHGASVHSNRTRNIWLSSPHYKTGTSEFYGIALDPNTDQQVDYSFAVPTDFASFLNLYVYYKADMAVGSFVLDTGSFCCAPGQSLGSDDDYDLTNIIATTNTNMQRFTTAGLLSTLAIGDIGTIYVNRDANNGNDNNPGDLVIIGVLIEYTADE